MAVSIGVASTVPVEAMRVETLIAAADRALYRAKLEGRNRICLCDESIASDGFK